MKRIHLGDVQINVLDCGQGAPLLLVHGFPLDHRMWLDQIEGLQDLRQCLAPDLRGSGSSDPVASGVLAMEHIADDLSGLIDGIGQSAADIVSLSMGGYAALALWERHPEKVRSLVLMDTRPGPDTEAGRAGRRETAEKVATEGVGALVSGFQNALLAPNAGLAARVRLRAMMEASPAETVVAALEGMARRADRTDMVATITVPTLIMVGEDDGLTPPEVAEHMAQLIPDADLVVLPGAGHLPPIETPEAVNQALRTFWERT